MGSCLFYIFNHIKTTGVVAFEITQLYHI